MPVDVVRDAPAKSHAPIDTNVRIPDSVKRAAAAADAYYQQRQAPAAPPAPEPAPAPVAEPVAEPVAVAPEPTPAPVVEPVAVAPIAPEPAAPAVPPADADIPPEQWEHRFRSMKGRYDAQLQINGQMQEQMQQLGDELVRTQQMLQRGLATPPTPNQPPATLITAEDQQNYGNDLIDLTKRAALEAVQPKLNELEHENQQLRQRVTQQSQAGVVQMLDLQLPNWREINRKPEFKRWLSLRDLYSGVVRKQMLDAAYQAADAPRVVAFFKGFVSDEAIAAGTTPPAPLPEPPPAPRQAAIPLERLAAPGRARPAGGNDAPNVPADKPIFTRKQISGFYDEVRRGLFAGREAEKAAREREIFSAQNEGRVR